MPSAKTHFARSEEGRLFKSACHEELERYLYSSGEPVTIIYRKENVIYSQDSIDPAGDIAVKVKENEEYAV